MHDTAAAVTFSTARMRRQQRAVYPPEMKRVQEQMNQAEGESRKSLKREFAKMMRERRRSRNTEKLQAIKKFRSTTKFPTMTMRIDGEATPDKEKWKDGLEKFLQARHDSHGRKQMQTGWMGLCMGLCDS